jgi:hypothetical protein
VKNKKQHIIPNCYLKAWCDPRTPPRQSPYIWRISKDGTARKNKSPEKSFTTTDKYTIKMPNGERNLVIENTLAGIENHFVGVLGRIRRRENLTPLDRARLCLFTAAMQTRTNPMGQHWKQNFQRVHNQVVALEKKCNALPGTSLEMAEMVENAHQHLIESSWAVQAPLLFRMPMSILVADDDLGFITTDNPCVWFNPNWYKMPPFLRPPGLGQTDIEVTLPLSPNHLLFISHRPNLPYIEVNQTVVDETNRACRFNCDEEFVSWKGETRPYWFDPGKEPEDTWESSPEGQLALAEQEKYRKRQADYEEWKREQEAEKQKRQNQSGDEP